MSEKKDNPYSSMLQEIKISCKLGRQEMFELGRKKPYARYVNFHTEVKDDLFDKVFGLQSFAKDANWGAVKKAMDIFNTPVDLSNKPFTKKAMQIAKVLASNLPNDGVPAMLSPGDSFISKETYAKYKDLRKLKEINDSEKKNECICSTRDIMRQGCTCGHQKRYNPTDIIQ